MHRRLATVAVAGLLAAAAACTGVDARQPFYDGLRNSAQQCRLKADPQAAPCAELPEYDRYQADRARAQTGAASAARPAEPGRKP